jgi:hypothetical protein
MMCASIPVSRTPCRPFSVGLSLIFHKLADRIRGIIFGEEAVLKELTRLRTELEAQKQAIACLCDSIRSEDEVLGRILAAQFSLYLEHGAPQEPLRNYI